MTARERVEEAIREYSAECASFAREADGHTDAKRVHGLNIIGGCLAEVVAALDALVAEVREEEREACAEIATRHKPAETGRVNTGDIWARSCCDNIAAAIRAKR